MPSSSSNVNINESPYRFMILDTIARGMTNINKIAKATKINDDAEIELIVNDLLIQRLIIKSEKRDFWAEKRRKLE
jgi:hypothetical protein